MKETTITIQCKNTGKEYSVVPGTSLLQFLEICGYSGNKPALAAYVDNKLKELSYELFLAHSVEFLTIENEDGRRTYARSLSLLLQCAANRIFPQYQLTMDYSLPSGIYCEIREKESKEWQPGRGELTPIIDLSQEELLALKEEMERLVKAALPLDKRKISTDKAIALYRSRGQNRKAELHRMRGEFYSSIYYLGEYGDTFYGPLAANTKDLGCFNLIKYNKGFCLQLPSRFSNWQLQPVVYQQKLADIFSENSNWCRILGAHDIPSLNAGLEMGYGVGAIQIAEALHERKYASIADMIGQRRDKVKLVLIAGPSSSGKTTTSMRIALQLKIVGLNPVVVAMDVYFVERDKTPLDENGQHDFESVYALDIPKLNGDLKSLFAGDEVELPKFDFTTGKSNPSGVKVKMAPNDVLIMEGIHALNPVLTKEIEEEKKFKVYASALTTISIDENNYVSTTDLRLIRRIVRDNNFRNYSAEATILRWPSVVRGENKNIFPFQENADAMFNSSLIYELPLLKHYAAPLLRRIAPSSPAYAESLRLRKFLSFITELNTKEIEAIPPTSVMREFIGGSTFKY